MRRIDLRSDTITQPTPAMRQSMLKAQVGDDVFGEDPTVKKLEGLAAEITGKQSAMFVPSGTMANLICLLTHCQRGDEVILGDQSHIFYYEQGGSAAIGGIHPRPAPNLTDGRISLEDLADAVRADDIHFPKTRLIALENTHNRCSGSPLPAEYLQQVALLASRLGIKLHIDGARLFNAAVALGVEAKTLADPADSICFCLSKGLAAPVGSLVCGSHDFIVRARRNRKVLGGGMRQAGILAAAGIVSLNEMIPRLAQDHVHARQLAQGLAQINGISVNLDLIKTNIVFFDIIPSGISAACLSASLAEHGIYMLPFGSNRMRAVTHYHISADDIAYVIQIMQSVTLYNQAG